MTRDTISREEARRFYDRLGRMHDLAECYEGRAKARALESLQLQAGLRVLNVGVGTGKEQSRIKAIVPGDLVVGLDISRIMLDITRRRTGSPVCMGETLRLPFKTGSIDRLFSSYLMDLIPDQHLVPVLREFHRVLKPGGIMSIVTLTEGTTVFSRILMAGWRLLYAVNPMICGGCRPLHLAGLVGAAGFVHVERKVILQLGIPSELVAARRD